MHSISKKWLKSFTKQKMIWNLVEKKLYWEHQDVKFEYKASIQNKENTGNHTEISCIKEEVEVDIVVVAESQRPQMT